MQPPMDRTARRGMPMAMRTEHGMSGGHAGGRHDHGDRVRLVQLLSPAFPIGGFAYSQGLEGAMASGAVRDEADVRAWVGAVLRHGAGRCEGILLAQARRPGADLGALEALARALSPSRERLAETLEQGRAFSVQASVLTGRLVPALPLPLAIGAATAPLRVPTADVVALALQAMAAQLVSAAVRFLPLGQTVGQRILYGMAGRIVPIARFAAAAPVEAISSFTPGADMASMEHETQIVRIFRT